MKVKNKTRREETWKKNNNPKGKREKEMESIKRESAAAVVRAASCMTNKHLNHS